MAGASCGRASVADEWGAYPAPFKAVVSVDDYALLYGSTRKDIRKRIPFAR